MTAFKSWKYVLSLHTTSKNKKTYAPMYAKLVENVEIIKLNKTC